MNTEIISAGFALLGIVISGVISLLVSRLTTAKEIKKMKLEWEREDISSLDSEFSDMVSAVALYSRTQRIRDWNNAISKTAGVRSKEKGALAQTLDTLYIHLKNQSVSNIESCLTQAITEKRNGRSKQ